MAHDDTASEDWSISRSCSTAYSTNKSFTSTDSDSDSETLSSHSTKLNVLIYVQHCQTLKTFTPAEQQEVLNTMPFAHEIKCKLDHVGPIAAIYLDNSTTSETTNVYTITLNGMQRLYEKLTYVQMSKRTLKYTLIRAKDVQPYASPLTQIYNNNHLIDTYKASIMSESNPKRKCAECSHAYRTKSALARHRKTRHSIKNKNSHVALSSDNNLQKEIFKPPILEEASCPSTYNIYWNLKAKTRRLPPDNRKVLKFVAPRFPITMLQLAEQVNFPELLSKEFETYAHAYDSIVKQRSLASIETVPFHSVGVQNSVQDLSLTGQTRILDSLKKKAPALETKTLNKVSESELTNFFFQARTYMLTNSIPWDSFSDYFITPTILGKEIYGKVTSTLKGYPTHKQLIKNFSCFIEHIMLRLLPVQESYYDAEIRIIAKHKQQLTGPNPSIEYTKTYIQSDALDLTTKSPFYKQVRSNITDEQHKMMIENESTNLLHKIIANTLYDAEIHKLLIGSECYKEITDIPNNVLLDYIQSLIVAEDKSARALTKLSLN